MPIHARLLILAKDLVPLHGLGDELDRLGLKTLLAQDVDGACIAVSDLGLDAALVAEDILSAYPDVVAQLKAAAAPRHLPVMGICENIAAPEGLSLGFKTLPNVQQLLLNTEHLVRAAIASEELESRISLFKKNREIIDLKNENPEPVNILSIGQPAPEFLALSHALRPSKAQIVAALTSYSAFDYLHDKAFDAVLLWSGDAPSDALAIASGMRRNTRLYHTPILLRLTKPAALDVSEAYMRGINDIADATTPMTEVAAQLLQLATLNRSQMHVRKTLEDMRTGPEMDPGTGLFGRNLFASHLARLARACAERNRVLSVCVLRVVDSPEVARARERKTLDRALVQVGSMVGRLIRTEDTAGRLSNDVFALALPATPMEMARQVSERIAAVVACTAFDNGEGASPFVVELDFGLAQLRPHEDPAETLARAANNIAPHAPAC